MYLQELKNELFIRLSMNVKATDLYFTNYNIIT
jgi:hypothetical protein